MYVAIAGNIGSGKTTLTNLLAKNFSWQPLYEEMEDNPYITNFYEDMRRWAFNLQIYFLQKRFSRVVESCRQYDNIIQDRTLFEDAYIFAPTLHSMGLLVTRDYQTYLSLFNLMITLVKSPDLLIYLKASVPTLINQISKRGREYESSIRLDYITTLNKCYDDWINQYTGKKLIIDVDNLNIIDKPEDLGVVIEKVNGEINGLF
ncbi:MAG: deoxynucleoside kinase [Bacteroidales bacterium]|jgi:deoxyadenosine/deoxycytidine kinase|nr:deoxynucleoside kinase [Bacteroidales bacterium]